LATPPVPKRLDPYTPTGSNIRQTPTVIQGREKTRLLLAFSKCVQTTTPRKVDFYLRHSDGLMIGAEVGNVVEYLRLPFCMGRVAPANMIQGLMRIDPRLLRSWLAEQAYLAENPNFTPVPADALPAPERNYYAPPERLADARAVGALSDCMVANDAAGADRLVRTAWDSNEEASAAQALAPALGACMRAGQKLTLKPENIRGWAAQGLWQRYEAGKPIGYQGRP
jgi:hypothetical protein